MDRNSKNRNLSKNIAELIVLLEGAGDQFGNLDLGPSGNIGVEHLTGVLRSALALTGFGPGGPDELDMLEATHAEV